MLREGHVLLKNGCKKFHGHYSAANFSTPRLIFRRELEFHARKLITVKCCTRVNHNLSFAAMDYKRRPNLRK